MLTKLSTLFPSRFRAIYFPSSYYIKSRYNGKPLYFLFYLFRYWFILSFFLNEKSNNSIFTLFFSLLIYYSFYDFFCLENDKIAKNEKGGTNRLGNTQKDIKVKDFIIWVLSSSLILGYFSITTLLYNFIIISLTVFVFYLHNRILYSLRILTYSLLYFLKVFLMYQNFKFIETNMFLKIIAVASLWNIVHIINYSIKKSGLKKLSQYWIEIIRWSSYYTCFLFINDWLNGLIILFTVYTLEFILKKIEA